jgi:hypothetical protein
MKPLDWLLVAGLALLAWAAPLLLYLLALGIFGLPHVIWEMAWVRRTAGPRLPRLWWLALGAMLALQGGARLATLLGGLDPTLAPAADLLTLALALGLVLALPGRGLRKAVALAAAAALAWVGIGAGAELTIPLLVALSVAHNFTPIGLVRLSGSPARVMLLPFLLPLALLALPGASTWGPEHWAPMEAAWLDRHLPLALPGLLPALVLAQCLHYLAVLRILPGRLPGSLLQGRSLWLAVAACLGLSLVFLLDFPQARRFYGVASGMHAWLEWPILLGLCGWGERGDAERRDDPGTAAGLAAGSGAGGSDLHP